VKDLANEATIAAVANKVAYGGGGVAFIGGLAASDIAAFGGLLIALTGLVIQWYYKRRADRREAEFHRARLRGLGGE
jgi:hypothetical protein